ncbi:putative oligosaccharyl transferase subunit [Eremomyces bilateralis CBS 781.70]|uniref:Dolichyl-diphosphooligosaccharide--protein glycosyltransferase subunit WBP1 n=1 Tax=Eremomyces bilateralis CBS 781.70 TaxID=1392243 RepID=A0A6G1FZ92_9PEZI|nr:putative oligosaccharyl transferase subunit [Eremomyces bilateralis CBS 781.70]KAF1810879.1 putative oligosaccharyl transferase subunit [Eremomyces bilateralis CBS 781.70]
MKSIYTWALLALSTAVNALSSSGQRLLVVLEDAELKGKYSQFLGDLESRGYQISVESPKNDAVTLFKHGELAYDHLILLPPKSKAYGPNLTPTILLEYLKNEGNILLPLSANTATPTGIVSLLLELDIHLPPDRNALVVDHFNYDTRSASDKHDVLTLPRPGPLRPDAKNYFGGDGLLAVPRAVGQTLGNASPLLAPILTAPATSYSYNPKEDGEAVEELFATGSQMALATGLQARNSARLTVLGSAEMLEDGWFEAQVQAPGGKKSKAVNRDFARQITEWTFKEVGVLKVGKLQHYLNEGANKGVDPASIAESELNPKIYRIKNDVTYTIELSEYSHDHWTPFIPPSNDALQLEFTMLSPFHRLPLTPLDTTANSTLFGAAFTTPDQHGIFSFRVNYKRPFLTAVDEKDQVTLRHMAHDEWPRSWQISGAWTWIAGVWVTVGGWLAFLALWLYSAPTDKKGGVKKRQ